MRPLFLDDTSCGGQDKDDFNDWEAKQEHLGSTMILVLFQRQCNRLRYLEQAGANSSQDTHHHQTSVLYPASSKEQSWKLINATRILIKPGPPPTGLTTSAPHGMPPACRNAPCHTYTYTSSLSRSSASPSTTNTIGNKLIRPAAGWFLTN